MSQYQPPYRDAAFLLKHVFSVDAHAQRCGLDLDADTALAILDEAGKFARDRIDTINRAGDMQGARWSDSTVTTAPGFKEAYQDFCAGGWQGLRFPEQYGGQGLNAVVASLIDEMWHGASFSFALCPMLTNGAVEALLTAGSDYLKDTYVPKMVSGEWTGTMNLTEPGAGSDLAAIRSRAVPQADGTYRISGQKIFITYGEHDYTDNIVHLVLARTPDAPAGVKGISLFAVPKFMVQPDGSLGARNDVRCSSIEHKLGIHGSPTAVMLFGEGEGAVGYLVGEENRGLEYMFIMMNDARFSVGLQGLAISERAYQHAAQYALERVQGRAVGDDGSHGDTIVRHPDVRRMLLSMRSHIDAMRALAVHVAMKKDAAHSAGVDAAARDAAKSELELLVPVLKGWFTETAQDLTYNAVQVFGGMGYVEETGAAQYYRDARITTIYEGTTAIQANDLVGRKTVRDGGQTAFALLDTMAAAADSLAREDASAARVLGARLAECCRAVRGVVHWLLDEQRNNPRAVYASSVPYLQLWGEACGGWMHALRLQAALGGGQSGNDLRATAESARFFAEQVLVRAPAMASAIVNGGQAALDFPDEAWLA
ncbi:acyl-CoA dehydrogenase [Pseudoduganella sp. UC29_106]|uniref:acyl-CoA dehydrogenase n=1 Tax=Pseudoduganella sp. UC29_106 TaxID=3374553 RepID=UPI00375784FC